MAAVRKSKSAFNINKHRKRKDANSISSNGTDTDHNQSPLFKGISMPNISVSNGQRELNEPLCSKSRKDVLKRKSFRLSIRKAKKVKQQISADKASSVDDCITPTQIGNRNSILSSDSGLSINNDDGDEFLDGIEDGESALAWLINPVKPVKFFEDVWEKKPLCIKRRLSSYNDGCFSCRELDTILRKSILRFSENLDVTSYQNGKRQTLNPDGRAHADTVWKYYNDGCSVRLLNPQTFSSSVWNLTSLLQDYFGCFVGANVYLTPPSSQGFAPHYDDIEAFIVQLEGKKHWRLYQPRSADEVLPLESSGNFEEKDIGSPILDRVLEAGDVMYFPRGYIHQARSLEDVHSLHITISVYQKQSWANFLEKAVSGALGAAIEEDVEFRHGLPIGILDHLGVAHSNKNSATRSECIRHINNLLTKMISYCPIDAAADQFAVECLRSKLPPRLTKDEEACTIFGNGIFWSSTGPLGCTEIELSTNIRLVRPGIARLISENSQIVLYHSMENSRVYHERDSHSMIIEDEDVSAVEQILNSYPEYIAIRLLDCDSNEQKVSIAKQLYNRGIIRTQTPLRQDSMV